VAPLTARESFDEAASYLVLSHCYLRCFDAIDEERIGADNP